LIADRALKFIDDNKDRPFFLYVPFTLPHGRFEAPDTNPYADATWPQPARFLASMISRLDATVGQIVERVQRHDLQRDTLILFTSDNGPVKLGADNFGSSGPLRGIKRDMYEGGIRVPFIARWTGRIKPGTSDQVFAFWDLLPTFADLTGQPVPKGLDGISVLPALMGTGPSPSPDRHLYWEFHERGFQQAVRWRDWKAVRDGLQGPVEIYDLAKDPSEQNNIAAREPEIARRMTKLLDTSRTNPELWKPKGRPPNQTSE
jgi:arylsulfatase A-like enzyme